MPTDLRDVILQLLAEIHFFFCWNLFFGRSLLIRRDPAFGFKSLVSAWPCNFYIITILSLNLVDQSHNVAKRTKQGFEDGVVDKRYTRDVAVLYLMAVITFV